MHIVYRYRKYTVREITAPKHYALDDDPIPFEILEHGKIYGYTHKDDEIPGTGKFIKTSEDGIVKGVALHIYGKSNTGIEVDETVVTDENGSVRLFLLTGTYTVEEISVADRYVSPAKQTVTISDIPKEKTITIDGKDHTIQLEDIKYESVPILHRTADVSTTVKLTEDEIKDSMIYRYADEDTGRNVNVILQKSSVSETDEVKENSISFPVIFHRHGSEEYVINSKMIPISDGESPLDEKYFPDVKAESDYADTDGEITALVWDGESYFSGGEVCRNALASLTEHRPVYEVTYSDSVELPDADG